jgi:hypothetical protein
MIEYHSNKGSLIDPIVSHSMANMIDPEIGGHPLNFKEYVEQDKDNVKETPSLTRGDLFHKWLDKPGEFVFAELEKPTPQMALFAETFNNLYFKEQYKITHGFEEYAKQGMILDINELLTINEIFIGFHGIKGSDYDIQLLSRCIFYARTQAEVNKALKNNTLLDKFQTECIAYIRFLQNAGDRIIVDKATKDVLINCQESYLNHPIVKEILKHEWIHEEEFSWEEQWQGITLKRRAKIDKYRIEGNKVIIIDNKTMYNNISMFPTSSYKSYKYGRQLYNYLVAICKKHNLDINTIEVELLNIVTQTSGLYPTMIFKTQIINYQAASNEGEMKTVSALSSDYNRIMNRVAYHVKHQLWDMTMEEHQQGYILI